MAFGFGKKREDVHDEDDDEEEEEVDLVNFQGALNGKTADMAANARLVQAALRPTKDLITDGLERFVLISKGNGPKPRSRLMGCHLPAVGCRSRRHWR